MRSPLIVPVVIRSRLNLYRKRNKKFNILFSFTYVPSLSSIVTSAIAVLPPLMVSSGLSTVRVIVNVSSYSTLSSSMMEILRQTISPFEAPGENVRALELVAKSEARKKKIYNYAQCARLV